MRYQSAFVLTFAALIALSEAESTQYVTATATATAPQGVATNAADPAAGSAGASGTQPHPSGGHHQDGGVSGEKVCNKGDKAKAGGWMGWMGWIGGNQQQTKPQTGNPAGVNEVAGANANAATNANANAYAVPTATDGVASAGVQNTAPLAGASTATGAGMGAADTSNTDTGTGTDNQRRGRYRPRARRTYFGQSADGASDNQGDHHLEYAGPSAERPTWFPSTASRDRDNHLGAQDGLLSSRPRRHENHYRRDAVPSSGPSWHDTLAQHVGAQNLKRGVDR